MVLIQGSGLDRTTLSVDNVNCCSFWWTTLWGLSKL